jgi:hypothetical protein
MSAKAQVPAYVEGSWYPSGTVADAAEIAGSTVGLLRPDWPDNFLDIGQQRWFVCQGASAYDSVALQIARGVSEIELLYVDLDPANASIGEYHVMQQAPGAPAAAQLIKYVDPTIGNVTQTGDADALRSRMIIFAPLTAIVIDVTVAPGADANMGVLATART